MGMALPNPKYDDQFRVGNLQAEEVLPPAYGRTLDIPGKSPWMPRLRLWDLNGRWMSLPMSFRRILAACFVLAILAAFSSAAYIQTDSVKGKIEVARRNQSSLMDRLDEIESSAPAFNSHINGIGRGSN